jgi:hypothetical protein
MSDIHKTFAIIISIAIALILIIIVVSIAVERRGYETNPEKSSKYPPFTSEEIMDLTSSIDISY